MIPSAYKMLLYDGTSSSVVTTPSIRDCVPSGSKLGGCILDWSREDGMQRGEERSDEEEGLQLHSV